MKTPEQITQWLKDQRLYGKFYVNYNRYMHRRWKFNDFLKKTAPEKLFSCAFVWHDTLEGNAYWNRMNNKYLKWLNNEKDNVQ